MNYANLDKEIIAYKNFSKQVEQTLLKLSLFFKTFSDNGIIFLDNTEKSLEEFYQELNKENRTTTHNISFGNFYKDFKSYIEKVKDIFIQINKNISDRITEYIIRYQNICEESNNKLNTMLSILSENKIKLEKDKYNYFDSCKTEIEYEKKSKGKNKQKDISKYEANSENHKKIYKNELKKFNELLENNEKRYQIIINNYENEYSYKLKFLSEIINKFNEYGKNFNDIHHDLLTKLEKNMEFISIKRDLEYFKKDINYINDDKKRFITEKFLDYEIFKKHKEKTQNENFNKINFNEDNSITLNGKNIMYNISNENSIKVLDLCKNSQENFEVEGKENIQIDEYIIEILENSEDFSREKYLYLLQYVENDNKKINNFMELLLNHYNENKFKIIKNFDNLKLLSNILSLIVSCSYYNKEIFEVCYMVMFIAEKTIYFNKDNNFIKCYLCKILPKETVFSSINFWKELMNSHINLMTDFSTRKEVEKRDKLKVSNKNNNGMLKKFGNKINDFEKIENEILYNQIYNEKLVNYSIKVLDVYLKHFSNFNLEHKKAAELIVDMSVIYKFDNSYVAYFMAQLNSDFYGNLNTNKKENFFDEDKNKINSNKVIDCNNLYFKLLDKKAKNIEKKVEILLLYSCRYLNYKEISNLFAINKLYNQALMETTYKYLLIKLGKGLDISKHISIWKLILKCKETKSKYNYEEIKVNVSKNLKEIKSSEIIELDIIRTKFDKDINLKQTQIGNILKAIGYSLPNFNYYQGMNYIAAFLLNITNNEEESFYLFLSLMISTDYGKLYENDLEILKEYFYVFERLICILLPELYNHFLDNNCDVSFFISPWLITLFTNNYQNIKVKDNPLILLRIFDMFIFNGWKSIIRLGIILLKTYEMKLMSLSYEQLLSYLIGGICNNEFFQNEYYDNLVNLMMDFKIDNNLIENIEKEYELRLSILKNGGNDIFGKK